MELKEYIKQSERTMSDKGFSMNMLHASLGIVTETAELLDAYKKHIFYDKPLDLVNIQEEIGDIFWYLAIPLRSLEKRRMDICINQFNLEFERYESKYPNQKGNLTDLLIHLHFRIVALSKSLNFAYDEKKEYCFMTNDLFLVFESISLLCNQLKLDIKEILQININKLAKRYPDKFDSNLALNRDLKAEREVLEGLNTKTEQVDYKNSFIVSPSDYKQMQELGMIPKEKENVDNIDLKTIEGEGKGLFEYLKSESDIKELHDKGLFVDNSGIDSRVPKVVVEYI